MILDKKQYQDLYNSKARELAGKVPSQQEIEDTYESYKALIALVELIDANKELVFRKDKKTQRVLWELAV